MKTKKSEMPDARADGGGGHAAPGGTPCGHSRRCAVPVAGRRAVLYKHLLGLECPGFREEVGQTGACRCLGWPGLVRSLLSGCGLDSAGFWSPALLLSRV